MPTTSSRTVTITNKLGLHARPAMLFVELAGTFESDVSVRRVDGTEAIDGKSIMQMMMLAATQGTELEIEASGDDADEAVRKLEELVKSRFSED